jgi:hypothetical protein
MKISFFTLLVFISSENCQAEGFFQSVGDFAKRAAHRISEVANFNEAPIRQRAEEVKARIQSEIEREYSDLAPNDDGIYPSYQGHSNQPLAYYDMGNANHRALRARERLDTRREAQECQSQNLAELLRNSLFKSCGINQMQYCQNVSTVINQHLQQSQQRQNELTQGRNQRANMQDLARLQNRLIVEVLPSTEEPLSQCYEVLRQLSSNECLSVYDQVFDQSMQHNLTYLCLPETIDNEVDLFVRSARAGQISRSIIEAQSHYAEGRRAQIALAHLAGELTNLLTQLTASHREEAPPTGDL